MKRIALTLISLAAFALTACGDDQDALKDGAGARGGNGGETSGGEDSTFDHSNDSPAAPGTNEQPPEPGQIRLVGSPEVTSRLHSCGKLTVSSFGTILASRGLTGQGQGRPNGSQSGQQIFNAGATAAALGAANYNGRVPEAPFASTSTMSKMYDIFVMSSYDAVSDNFNAPACPGVKVLEGGKFTKDGITCLMGKPATDEHVAIANDAIAKNPTDGAKIAVAALMSAAHTCQ